MNVKTIVIGSGITGIVVASSFGIAAAFQPATQPGQTANVDVPMVAAPTVRVFTPAPETPAAEAPSETQAKTSDHPAASQTAETTDQPEATPTATPEPTPFQFYRVEAGPPVPVPGSPNN